MMSDGFFQSLDSSLSLRPCDAGDLGYLQGIYT